MIRTGFVELGRPLKKLISISERGDYPLPVEVQSAKEYIRKPFTTFLAETDGYPRLKSVMSALSEVSLQANLPSSDAKPRKSSNDRNK